MTANAIINEANEDEIWLVIGSIIFIGDRLLSFVVSFSDIVKLGNAKHNQTTKAFTLLIKV